MKEILEALAAAQGWIFTYGRKDFQNLFEQAEQKDVTHIFLDPVEISKVRNDQQEVESLTYSGSFMMLYSSDIDEVDYNYRYENYIKPIINTQLDVIENELICNNEATITEWKLVEVINMFDYNLDGIIVTYRLNLNK